MKSQNLKPENQDNWSFNKAAQNRSDSSLADVLRTIWRTDEGPAGNERWRQSLNNHFQKRLFWMFFFLDAESIAQQLCPAGPEPEHEGRIEKGEQHGLVVVRECSVFQNRRCCRKIRFHPGGVYQACIQGNVSILSYPKNAGLFYHGWNKIAKRTDRWKT